MTTNLAIDFGTTNSVIARWDGQQGAAVIDALPGLSTRPDGMPALVPSLVYVHDGRAGQVTIGQAVREGGWDRQRDNRLFRNFKRGIVTTLQPEPRAIDGMSWDDRAAADHFMRAMLAALPCSPEDIDQLVLTAPVASFSGYLHWLSEVITAIPAERVRVVDESTAAALGYAVTEPDAVVLVVDFGGGTLDLSLVQLPESKEKTGGLLGLLRREGARQHTARVIAKAGRILGGSDVDQWLLAEVLTRASLTPEALGPDYAALLAACEEAKIALSLAETAGIAFTAAGRPYQVAITRPELEHLLEANGFYNALRQAVDRVMHIARRQGIFKEDIRYVLLVGGTSLMPSVQDTLGAYFTETAVRADKPFTAVAEGALQVAAGFGLDDYLTGSYGLRYLDPATGQIAYDEIIAEGTRYPMAEPLEVILGPAHDEQDGLELVVGEIGIDTVAMVEVRYEDGQTVFVAHGAGGEQHVSPLNGDQPVRVPLSPPGAAGERRIRASFQVDDQRQLRVTAVDLRTKHVLLDDVCLAKLGAGASSGPAGRSIMPPEGVDVGAYYTQKAQEVLAEMNGSAPDVARETASGYEPALVGDEPRGQHRLSLRRLGAMLNVLPPEAITLDAAAAMLESDEFYVRYSAGRMLARRGDRPARLVIADALNSAKAPTRASAARHLYGFSWHSARSLVEQTLADPDRRVREAAVYALCDMRLTPAFRRATAALQHEDDEVRAAAAWSLRECPSPEAVPVLEAVLLADDPEVRVKAMEALGANGTPEARALVRTWIERDPDTDVTYAATLSLLEIAEDACLPELCDLIRGSRGTAQAAILKALFHATNYLKINVAMTEAAGNLIAALQTALLDPLPAARMAAVWPLAWMQDERAAAVLVEAFAGETDPEIRQHMVRVCTSLMSPAAERLIEAS